MRSAKVSLTKEGYDRLVAQLQDLKNRREPTVLRLQAAREMGDLSENGAYQAARFELSDIDRNIRRIEGVLKYAEIVEAKHDGKVGFGSRVVLEKDKLTIEYTIVSHHESDPAQQRLSAESPLGMALVGKKVGEIVIVEAPAGKIEYRIKKIS